VAIRSELERVALDSSVLLGSSRSALVAAVALGYCEGYWSTWIVGEFVRRRTEWIADRAARDGCHRAEVRRRLRESRQRVNALINELSHVLQAVDYAAVPTTDLGWLTDPDDWPVMQTALAVPVDILVTDNSSDFPLDETRNGILILGSIPFLTRLYQRWPDAKAAIDTYLADGPSPPS